MTRRAISARPIAHHRHVIDTHLNPRFLGQTASYDAASYICHGPRERLARLEADKLHGEGSGALLAKKHGKRKKRFSMSN